MPKPPCLPIRLPGQLDLVVIGQDSRQCWHQSTGSHAQLVSPTFLEDLEIQVQSAAKRIGKVSSTRDLSAADPALSRILSSEARRRAKNSNWSFEKPLFDAPVYQRQLRLFNSLARAFRPLYGAQHIACEDEWIQGLGTVHHLHLHLRLGAARMKLNFREPTDNKRARDWKSVKMTTLQVGHKDSSDGVNQWVDSAEGKLEGQLTDIVLFLLRRAELSLRSAAQDHYESHVKRREAERLEYEASLRAEEARRLAAIATKRAKVRDEIVELSMRRSAASQIRATIGALRSHPAASGAESERFSQWSAHALSVAEALDPMNASLAEILGSFDQDLFA